MSSLEPLLSLPAQHDVREVFGDDGLPNADPLGARAASNDGTEQGEFDAIESSLASIGFLQGLLVDTNQSFEDMPMEAPSKDPLLLARERREEEDRKRKAAAHARMGAITEQSSRERQEEEAWREQVRRKKEAERERLAQEAAEAAAAEADTLAGLLNPAGDDSPLAAARRMWYENDMARQQAREQAIAAVQQEEEEWLGKEWQPRLNRHRDDLRAYREGVARREREALLAVAAAEAREAQAMAREEAHSRKFMAQVTAQCKRRAASWFNMTDGTMHAIVQTTIYRKQQEILIAFQRLAAQKAAEEEEQRQEAARKDREYSEWKQQVRAERCRRRRLEEREIPIKEDEFFQKRELELQGRDFYREREKQQMFLLEDTLKLATENSRKLQESGLSPKDVLENARMLATKQSEEHVVRKTDAVKVEGELWDTMLARNRLAKQQERFDPTPRTNRTPRWGVLNTYTR